MKGQAFIAMCGFRRRIMFMSPTTDFLFIPLPRMQQQMAMPMSTSRLIQSTVLPSLLNVRFHSQLWMPMAMSLQKHQAQNSPSNRDITSKPLARSRSTIRSCGALTRHIFIHSLPISQEMERQQEQRPLSSVSEMQSLTQISDSSLTVNLLRLKVSTCIRTMQVSVRQFLIICWNTECAL